MMEGVPTKLPTRSGGYDCDVLVLGGGVLGLAAARALTSATPGLRVVVVAQEAGSVPRRSGVVHSPIHRPPGSREAGYTLRGGAELAAFCAAHALPYARTGELVVAGERSELPRLHALVQRGRRHGLPVRELGPAQIARREPHLRGVAAIHVGATAVCDFAAVARQLSALVEEEGGRVRYGARLSAVDRRTGRGVAVRLDDGTALRTRALVNCAGPHSARVARLAGDTLPARLVPFRAEFYELAPGRRALVRGLVQPLPDPARAAPNIHLARGSDGTVRIGPRLTRETQDALAENSLPTGTARPVRQQRRHGALSQRAFTAAVQRLLPDVRPRDLVPAAAGVRARAVLPDGTLADDFLLASGPHTVHVLDAPPEAAAASLPIGREIADRALTSLAA
ncbi:L-2-hydroxyglutarate oxidase [Streptomyces sulphureus]|uniref:L-2-hydroxyglutarate oxidase n=1 Tax=Streptomyces sulphureus TaxID=47758 RepID=UPI00068775A9